MTIRELAKEKGTDLFTAKDSKGSVFLFCRASLGWEPPFDNFESPEWNFKVVSSKVEKYALPASALGEPQQ